MPKKVMPSESSLSLRFSVREIDGKFYVEEAQYDELATKLEKAKDTITYTMDKWFLSIENRMRDQDRVMTATSRYERAANKISQLEKEISQLNKTIHELKMEIAKPPYRVMWEGQEVCRHKDFKLKFGNTDPAFPDIGKPSTTEPKK